MCGILTPIINHKRCFYNVSNGQIFNMEYENNTNDDAVNIGKYSFSQKGFNRANLILQNINVLENKLIIVDEIGPLELQQKGLHDSIVFLLQKKTSQLLFVIREGLVDDVIDYFKMNKKDVSIKNLAMQL